MSNILINTRYFDKEKKVYKVSRIKNKDTFRLCTMDGKNEFTKTRKELDNEYTKLTPSGFLVFSIVENSLEDKKQKDVLVALYRNIYQTENEIRGGVPYCVCRQNVINVFYDYSNSYNIRHYGMSLSVDTCPANVDYSLMMVCDKIYNNIAIAVYMDDDFRDLLKIFKHNPYNIVLQHKIDKFKDGFVGSLNELLEQEEFSKDFYKAFKIEEIDFGLKYKEDNLLLDRQQTEYFENYFKIKMFDAFVIKFDYTIKLSDIKKNYILIYSREDKELYIVIYTEGKMYDEYMAEHIRKIKNMNNIFNSVLIK